MRNRFLLISCALILLCAIEEVFSDSRLPEMRQRHEQNQREAEMRRRKETSKPAFTAETLKSALIIYQLAGSSVKLLCDAYGVPEPLMEWRKNRRKIENANERLFGEFDFNVHDYSLNLANLALDDSGNYTCVRANKHGMVKRIYDLRVVAPGYHVPLITGDFRRNKTALIHDNVTFSCTYISGTLPFEVNWVKHYQKDGKWEDNRSGVQFIQFLAIETTPHQQQTDLHLYKVKRKDTGWYSCHVKNRLGVRKADFWLTVTDTISNETRLIERIEVNGAEFWSVVAALCLLAALFMIAVVVVMSYASRKSRCCHARKPNPPPIPPKRRVEIESRPSTSEVSAPFVRIVSPDPAYDLNPAIFNEVAIPLDSSWELHRSQVELTSQIGAGEFGEVWEANYWRTSRRSANRRPPDMQVAVKRLKSTHNEADLVALVSEMEVMKQIWRRQGGHENIVNIIGCCTQGTGPVMLVMDLCKYGNLREFLRNRRDKPSRCGCEPLVEGLTLDHLLTFAYQIAQGMEFLECCRCLHRDLAARNIMVDDRPTKNPLKIGYVAKIGDFGLAKRLFDKDYYHRQNAGRLPVKWMAPECFIDRTFSFPSDVWSFGILLWEIMTMGGSPYPTVQNPQDVLTYIRSGARNSQPPGCPNSMYGLMVDCWQVDPLRRPTFKQLSAALLLILRTSSSVELSQFYSQENSTVGYTDEEEKRKIILRCASAPAFTDYLLLMHKH